MDKIPAYPREKVIRSLTKEEESDRSIILYTLESLGATVVFSALGHRTTICHITEPDGWETVGVSYTKTPENFSYDVGKYWALKDAVDKLGSGRFYADIKSPVAQEIGDLVKRIDG